LCDYGTIDRRIWSARQKIGPVSTELIKTWELEQKRLRLKYDGVDVKVAMNQCECEMQRLPQVIAAVEGDYARLAREQEAIDDSLRESEDLLRGVHLGKDSDPRREFLYRAPNLAVAIHNRVAEASAVLVIVYPYSAYRTCIEFEYHCAFVLGVPILAIARKDLTDRIPPDLIRYGALRVNWDASEIREALQRSLRGAADRSVNETNASSISNTRIQPNAIGMGSWKV
jgi:hypothetical protein